MEHLSLLAHLSSLSLCHPPLTMVSPGDSQLPKLRPFRPLSLSLPCDVHLLNLRTMEDTQVKFSLRLKEQFVQKDERKHVHEAFLELQRSFLLNS